MTESPKPRGVLLGIDHGAKIMGVAICDALWIAARPLGLLERTTRAADFALINEQIEKYQVVGIVVGMPDNPEPERGNINQGDTVRRWVTRLAAAVPIPVYAWEEQFSSLEAERLAEEAELPPQDRIDDRAAAVILQTFIDAHPVGMELPPPIKQR